MQFKTKYILFFLLIFNSILNNNLTAQIKKIKFSEFDSLQIINKKNTIIFIHTDWCVYCKIMTNSTFKNNEIIEKINKDFYFIELNGEEKKTIQFNSHTFNYKPTGVYVGTHELALELATINHKIAYPTICVLNNKKEIIFQKSGYLNNLELLLILKKIETSF